ncbi:unnamed protein product (macronuclear) [Paramecium tetraurelia]|uniref:Uncharacterized protein n=1 Tax=Paramecium tetraurelia TaxID=5888 RepID=A0CL45_PARTE|nr:uncharacterized protein GSPATT00008059001 [Paramecium tetraurelia]CAK71512.1 unnamed protein product [Paramecium tetraurelia]|eukprot:XP_001438909.1 hypothetical protein (macronuclear) [Paramecium tetraurelia strain d4-2]
MKGLGVFLIGIYIAIYGIQLLTDPWTQLHYDRSVRQSGMKNFQQFVALGLKVRSLYGFAHIFAGYCLMNKISSMKLIISCIFAIDIIIQTGFQSIHQIFQDVVLIGIVNYV